MSSTAVEYPEHEKLSKVKDESQVVGEFLDIGLGKLGLFLYENRLEECTCESCERGETEDASTPYHSEAHEFKEGRAFYQRQRPAMRNLDTILAEHFGIDQEKLAAEKEEMYKKLVEMNS